jgi:NADPH:quinone reductase-like Zn-dependent oxidoreductase
MTNAAVRTRSPPGGVASFGIQLAKHIGAKIIATASAKNHKYVAELEADQVIDYNSEDFRKIGRICDVFSTRLGVT